MTDFKCPECNSSLFHIEQKGAIWLIKCWKTKDCHFALKTRNAEDIAKLEEEVGRLTRIIEHAIMDLKNKVDPRSVILDLELVG